MPINFGTAPRQLSPEESGGTDLFGSLLSGFDAYNTVKKQQATAKQMAEDLLGRQLQNKINTAKAQYANENELADLAYKRAGTGNLSSQEALHRGNLGLLPYQQKLLEAQYQTQLANAEKSKALSGLYGSALSGSGNAANTMQQGNYPDQLAQHMNNPVDYGNQEQNNQQQGAGPNKANLVAGLLHLPVSSQVVNGQLITNNPLSGISSTKVGPSAEENALASGLGKYGAKLYGDTVDIYRGMQSQGVALNELKDAVENNPEFKNVTGRINQPLTNWFGSPEQQELLGKLQSSSGEIALQVAPALKGAFTGRDQTLINSIKASPNDFPDVFVGKLKAQLMINNVLQERARITAELIEKGTKPLEASRKAVELTPLEQYRPQIKQFLAHKEPLGYDDLQRAKLELARRKGVQ